MKKPLIAAGTLYGLLLTGGLAGMASAQSAAEATGLTEEQIIAIALDEVPGELTEIERERHGKRAYYEVEIVDAEGADVEIKIAADTGQILEIQVEDDDCADDDDTDDL